MNASATMLPDDAPPAFDLPMIWMLLIGTVSAVAALMATVSLEWPPRSDGGLAALLHVQAGLLAIGAAGLAAGSHERLRNWEARVAPQPARDRIRAALQRMLGVMMSIGLCGPLLLAAVQGWRAGAAQPLIGSLAVLGAAATAGLCLVQGWQGRAPRGLFLAGLVSLLGLLAVPGAVETVSGDRGFAALALVLTVGAVWRAAFAPQALAVCAAAMPRLSLRGRWRRVWAQRGWQLVPELVAYRTLNGQTRRPSWLNVLGSSLLLLSQAFIQSRHTYWLGWGQAYEGWRPAMGFGIGLFLLAVYARSLHIGPPLHWRRRLAPHGIVAPRWASRMVWGSMLAFGLGIGLLVSLSMLVSAWTAGRAMPLSACLSFLGDALLASALMVWVRGRSRSHAWEFVTLLAVCLAAMVLLLTLSALGLTLHRGALWLVLELALSVALASAAVRVWAKRDLNAMG